MSPELKVFSDRLLEHAAERPYTTAVWGDELRIDYASLYAEIELRRELLRDVQANSIALALDNTANALIWDLAALLEEIPCVILPPFFSAAQRQHCLQQSQVQIVLADRPHEHELIDAGYQQAGLFWIREVNATRLPPGTAKLTYTSGSTGAPKGVCLSAAGIVEVALVLVAASQASAPTHHMALLPLAVLLENIGCYAALYAGATVSLPSQGSLGIQGASAVNLTTLLGVLARRQPDSLILVPQLLQVLVSAAEQGYLNPAGFSFLAVGGARVSEPLLQRARDVGLPVYEGYGLSECASVVALNRPGAQRPGSVGQPLAHVQLRLGEDGEVLVRNRAMLGYLDEASAPDQWWPTGDLGYFDADGYLFIKGRKKNQFITSFGRNVNPEWIEAQLTQGPLIAQAFVYGEALPRNHALLWPRHPATSDAQLQEAVEQANLALPGYAQVHGWTRLHQPFSTDNAMLTANGRPCRDAILYHYHHVFSAHSSAEDIAS